MKQFLRLINALLMIIMSIVCVNLLRQEVHWIHVLMLASFLTTAGILIWDFRNIKVKGCIRD